MRILRIAAVAAALVVLPLSTAFARGAGGFTWGEQYFDAQFSNYDLQMSTTGVFGYGVSYGGQRIGGFAMAVHSDGVMPSLDGGFIGAITGQEIRMGPFMAAVNLWTGIGGLLGPGFPLDSSLALVGELSLEIGIRIFPGTMLSGYVAMQAVTNAPVSAPLFSSVAYTPVFGMRLAWGSF
jgi:hypothetical protein